MSELARTSNFTGTSDVPHGADLLLDGRVEYSDASPTTIEPRE